MAICNARVAQLRMSVPSAISVPGSGGTAGARTYGPYLAGTYADIPLADLPDLLNAGLSCLGLSGPTSSRPSRRDQAWPILPTSTIGFATGGVLDYYDTDLAKWLTWDEVGQTWRDATTLAVA